MCRELGSEVNDRWQALCAYLMAESGLFIVRIFSLWTKANRTIFRTINSEFCLLPASHLSPAAESVPSSLLKMLTQRYFSYFCSFLSFGCGCKFFPYIWDGKECRLKKGSANQWFYFRWQICSPLRLVHLLKSPFPLGCYQIIMRTYR